MEADHRIRPSREDAIKLIRQNFAIIAGLNTFALALTLPRGLVSPGITALVSNGSAILGSMNSARPLLRNRSSLIVPLEPVVTAEYERRVDVVPA